MYPAVRVANFFIAKGLSEGESITPLKAQKLVYFAHGWHLALYGQPLINEDIQAWKFGPVVPSLYHRLKEFGNNPIEWPIGEFSGGYSTMEVVKEVEEKDQPFLDFIWKLYGKIPALQLSALTHVSNSPWDRVLAENGGYTTGNLPINNEWIKEYFIHQFQPNG